jgi:hypothetical protein
MHSNAPSLIGDQFFYGVVFFILYLLRKTFPFSVIWKYVIVFFIVLFGILIYNKWKEKK